MIRRIGRTIGLFAVAGAVALTGPGRPWRVMAPTTPRRITTRGIIVTRIAIITATTITTVITTATAPTTAPTTAEGPSAG